MKLNEMHLIASSKNIKRAAGVHSNTTLIRICLLTSSPFSFLWDYTLKTLHKMTQSKSPPPPRLVLYLQKTTLAEISIFSALPAANVRIAGCVYVLSDLAGFLKLDIGGP